jgi:hypothetical protein
MAAVLLEAHGGLPGRSHQRQPVTRTESEVLTNGEQRIDRPTKGDRRHAAVPPCRQRRKYISRELPLQVDYPRWRVLSYDRMADILVG